MFLSIHQNHCVNHVSLLHKQKTQRNFNLEQSNATRPYCQIQNLTIWQNECQYDKLSKRTITTRAHGRTKC